MKSLSAQHHEILLSLFRASKGEAGYFVAIEESALLEDLARRKLIEIGLDNDSCYAALSEEGQELAAEIQREAIVQVKFTFDTTDPLQAHLVKQLANLANGQTEALLGDLFALHEALERGEIDALIKAYPEMQSTIQKMIRASVDSQMMAQEQHRINHLLGEISELKAMLTKQADYQQNPPRLAPVLEEDDEPIPAPKPVTLRPVLPHTPQGQPKHLAVPQFALPQDDEDSEDLFVVKKDEEAGKRASENFIQSLGRLQKG